MQKLLQVDCMLTCSSSRSFVTLHRLRKWLIAVPTAGILLSATRCAGLATMSTHTTLRDGSGTITVAPRNEAAQSALMVISHGLGDTGEGFVDVAEVSDRN